MKGRSRASVNHLILHDPHDEAIVNGCNWGLTNGYPARRRAGRVEYLHRLIAGDRSGLEIDHINGDKLDVRRNNLRHVSHRANTQNLHRASGSSVRGVSFCRRDRRWKAYAVLAGRQKFLGRFDTATEAAEVARRFRLAHMEGATS